MGGHAGAIMARRRWVWFVAALLAAACAAPIAGADAGSVKGTPPARTGLRLPIVAKALRPEPPRPATPLATAASLPPAVLPTITSEMAASPAPASADSPHAGVAPALAERVPSLLHGELDGFYALTFPTDRFLLRYAAQSRAAQDPGRVAALVQTALEHHERLLGIRLDGAFTAYAAGSLFVPPDQQLRGYSFSADRYFVFLHDGSGSAADQAYLAAHELMHLLAWNVWGRPSSFLVSEGVAVYAGMESISGSAQLPVADFCLAFARVGRLPWISDETLPYRGHNRNLENYYAAGCFVGWLIERYGAEPFGRVYPSGDFTAIYGSSLSTLDAEWHAAVSADARPLPMSEADLVRSVEQLAPAFDRVLGGYPANAAAWAAYQELDRLRMELIEGRPVEFLAALP